MALKSNVDNQVRGFYFAASGSDDFDGATIERPKATMQQAINAAVALSPPPSNVATANVTAAQGGSFSGGFAMAEFVSFNGQDVSLINSDAVSVTMSSNVGLELTTLVNFTAGATCVLIDGNSLLGFTAGFLGASGAGGIAVNITGAVADIFCDTSRVRLQGVGSIGYKITSTGTSPIDINVNTVGLEADNTVFVDYAPVSGTTVVNVSAVEQNGVTGTIAFKAVSGELIVIAGRVVTETVADISGDAQFSLKCNAMQGDTIAAGTSVVNYKSVGFINGDIDIEDTAIFLGDIHFISGNITLSGTSQATVSSALVVGDITVGVGCTLTCDILSHTGSVTNNGTINGNIGPHIEDKTTDETDTTLVLRPDGLRKVEWVKPLTYYTVMASWKDPDTGEYLQFGGTDTDDAAAVAPVNGIIRFASVARSNTSAATLEIVVDGGTPFDLDTSAESTTYTPDLTWDQGDKLQVKNADSGTSKVEDAVVLLIVEIV